VAIRKRKMPHRTPVLEVVHFRAIIILPVFLILSHLSMAQFTKGDKYIGISGLPVAWFNNGSVQSQGFIVMLYLGKFVSGKISIGAQPYYANLSGWKSIGINVYSRYYPVRRRTLFFLEASAGMGAVTSNDPSTFDNGLASFTLGPGLGYLINKSISIELMVQYQQWIIITEKNAGRSIVPSVGAIIYLNR